MKWRKIKKLLKEHPYILIKEASSSMSKARQDLEEDGYPQYLEMVSKVKATSNIPESTWKIVDKSIARRSNKKLDLSTIFINTLFRFRRFAIVGLCIALLAGFFTLVPAGRTLATQIAKFVIEVIEGWGIIKRIDSQAPEYDFEVIPQVPIAPDLEEVPRNSDTVQQSFASISEFNSMTGLMPCHIDSILYPLDRIYFVTDPVLGRILTITYMSGGNETSIVQTWGDEQNRLVVPDNQVYGSINIDDIEYMYYWDEADRTLNAFLMLHDSSVNIATQNFDFSTENLEMFLSLIIVP